MLIKGKHTGKGYDKTLVRPGILDPIYRATLANDAAYTPPCNFRNSIDVEDIDSYHMNSVALLHTKSGCHVQLYSMFAPIISKAIS